MKKRIILLLVAGLILATFLPACSSKRNTEALKIGTRVHNGMYNPLYAVTPEDIAITELVFEGLINIDEKGDRQINSRIVENHVKSSDGSVYTFVLKEGVKFANGKPLTAADIVFTYQTLADRSSTAYNKGNLAPFLGVEGYISGQASTFTSVEAMNDRTVMFKFDNDDPDNLYSCGLKILSKDYYPDWQQGNTDIVMQSKMRTPMGSGPYVINSITDSGLILHRNPSYWASDENNYKIDVIEITYYSDSELVDAFATGKIDFAPSVANHNTLLELKKIDKTVDGNSLEFLSYDSDKYAYLGFNTSIWYSKSWTIRTAVAHAFNRDEFIENYFSEYATKVEAPVPIGSDLYNEMEGRIIQYDYNPEKARELLASVNYTWDKNGIMQFDGGPVTLTFYADVSDITSEAVIEQLKKDLDVLGIELIVEYYSSFELVENLQSSQTKWNIFFAEDYWHNNDKYRLINDYTYSGIPRDNLSKYMNVRINLLANALLQNPNFPDKTKDKIYAEVLLEVNKYIPELPIYIQKNSAVVSSKVSGIEINRYQGWTASLENATLNIAEDEPT